MTKNVDKEQKRIKLWYRRNRRQQGVESGGE
jgi:hypothetical protein